LAAAPRCRGHRLGQRCAAAVGALGGATSSDGSSPAEASAIDRSMATDDRTMLLWSGKWVRVTVLGDQHGEVAWRGC
jgi:hypothetical protein